MKKIIFGMTIAASLFTGSLIAAQQEDEAKMKEQIEKFKKDCIKSVGESGAGLDEASIDQLCDCVGKKAGEIFTVEELEKLNNQVIDGISQDKLMKLQEAIPACAMGQ